MNREIVVTQDGSHSISIPGMKVTYHSKFGAIRESMHVFIKEGLQYAMTHRPASGPLYIFEMGFGTGLNALLTAAEAGRSGLQVYYEAIDAFPLEKEQAALLNYCGQLQRTDLKPLFEQLHQSEWNKEYTLAPDFTLKKISSSLGDYLENRSRPGGAGINLVYFDAFAPDVQPDLWTTDVFTRLHQLMAPGGVLITYCSKGDVRRAMRAAGFTAEKIPGPPGKWEITRAIKG
jgi:tRNA U34 5-methylaminomethyl-2-thiouridine-forming methyltransferase MnmC